MPKTGKVKILWSEFAEENLHAIHNYYKDNASKRVADTVINSIFHSTEILKKSSKAGKIEPVLEVLSQNHRFIISTNYKIVSKEIQEGILITDVFDSRQDPSKIGGESRLD